jgi:hypothetical protein
MASRDPLKAKQAERLGMGLSRASTTAAKGTSHSAFSSMSTIDQVTPTKTSHHSSQRSIPPRTNNSNNDFFDEYTFDEPSSRFDSDYPKIFTRDSYSGGRKQTNEPKFGSHSAFSSGPSKPTTSNTSSSSSSSSSTSYSSYGNKGRNAYRSSPPSDNGSLGNAQERFANSKSISSDQYFNRTYNDTTGNDSGSFNRFSNSKAISSDDYFGRSQSKGSSDVGNNFGNVMSKIAGAATNAWDTIQDQYHGYKY